MTVTYLALQVYQSLLLAPEVPDYRQDLLLLDLL